MTWSTAAVGDICEVVSGGTPKTSKPEYWDGGIPWATPKDLSGLPGSVLRSTPRSITSAGLRSSSAVVLPAGSILLSSRAPIGLVAIAGAPMATNQGFKSLVPGPRVDAGYLFHWLRTNTAYLQGLGNGATFKELSKASVERIEIPLPPLPEQHRIATILDQADALLATRRQVVAHFGALADSVFHDMFGDDKAPEVPLGELLDGLEGGKSIAADDPDSVSQYRVLKISAVTTNSFDSAQSKPVPANYHPPAHHIVRRGDLLFSRANTAELVGSVALVDEDVENLLLPDKLWRFVWSKPSRIEDSYAWFALRTPSARRQIRGGATGTGGSMKNISKAKLVGVRIPLPPLKHQRKFDERHAQIQSSRTTAVQALDTIERLRRSFLSGAFAGDRS